MKLTVQIPDELAERLGAEGGDLSRRALEALALEEYRSGHLSKAELRQLLGYSTRAALDGFLKAHGVAADHWSAEDAHVRGVPTSAPQSLRVVFEAVRGLADDLDVKRNPSTSRPVEL
ncbi:MAG: UPF0175 family protein [Chloroflexi bacterium]|nr:UPF0175 family protein [Chloroflexota bacterium]